MVFLRAFPCVDVFWSWSWARAWARARAWAWSWLIPRLSHICQPRPSLPTVKHYVPPAPDPPAPAPALVPAPAPAPCPCSCLILHLDLAGSGSTICPYWLCTVPVLFW